MSKQERGNCIINLLYKEIKMKTKKIITIFIIVLLFLLKLTPFAQAAKVQEKPSGGGGGGGYQIDTGTNPIDNPNFFKPGGITDEDSEVITQKASTIVGIIVTVGVVASAITLLVLGIKYMMGSASEKAEYKKSMLPYIIGAFLLFSASIIVNIIASIVQESGLAQ